MADELVSAHLLISGMVQGVGYRWFVMRKANEYDLKGYVRNLYTDDVEVEVEGGKGLITEFIKDLRSGPRSAHVTDIKIQWGDYRGKYKNFDIKF
ncbi:MAG: acylphosphatase [candidate division Zixibacteria bacterium]|nr:acylphosphatase [candidate division Zixibacteria bacterium]